MSRRWTAVVGYKCAHGHTVPMQGNGAAGSWYGLFCPAGSCQPSWRNPSDPWLVSRTPVSEQEVRDRMEGVRLSGVLHGGKRARP